VSASGIMNGMDDRQAEMVAAAPFDGDSPWPLQMIQKGVRVGWLVATFEMRGDPPVRRKVWERTEAGDKALAKSKERDV
jgi:hypothetical protein